MRTRVLLACVTSLVLLVTGCGGGGESPQATTPSSPPPSAALPPEPSPSPTLAPPKPPLRALPAKLPAGLVRTTGAEGVALTFDDGPDPTWTPKVLDRLKKAGVTATFCVVGAQVRKHPDLLRRIVREGHQLCNHSWNHDLDLARRPVAEIRADLVRTNKEIRRAVPDAEIPFYRQPGGRWTAEVVRVAKKLDMRSLHWTVDPQDWAKPTAATIEKRVKRSAKPGAVVLLHDGGGNRAATLAACTRVIAALKRDLGITKLG
ncbi:MULTISPECIES: polysaccharide deacetylase family protein [unclassified Micromonospora]|jgi:peptidoglycan/xylan/chitin deacetylase (PgdA/CDA1 family)|uniref:polysaccharide deacetylase family protein n=1 Tax=unclassified Micromonospora TaxID=2617518 RepID=UPI0010353C22|nr:MULTISPECIES: polysaccharide deacetylase family protein [unclassified Micromonospora]QKW11506.1 polysaccharide deacetylase family protein [Verrucosispora sp. NA02020]QKW11630.1 polysaccharide deacetylase family protein [Verrucosispora sp. NA02020]TBL43252.1 polysaccharide deacetylase family protein [Verrucosispora sp. SN26_14.1]